MLHCFVIMQMVKNLGMTIDTLLSLEDHIDAVLVITLMITINDHINYNDYGSTGNGVARNSVSENKYENNVDFCT